MTKTLLTALLFSSLSTSALAEGLTAQKVQEPIYFGLATRGWSYPAKDKPAPVITTQKRIPQPLYFRFAKGNS